MIKIKIKPREGDRLYEIHVSDGGNNESLLVSHQGYENAADAEALVRRLFATPRTYTAEEIDNDPWLVNSVPEPVDLTVQLRNGKGKHEMLR